MIQGQSVFSGLMVPHGKGLSRVGRDGKVAFTFNNKERNFMEAKVNPRNVKWTASSRAFFKKESKKESKDEEIFIITKKIRGFNLIPKGILAEQSKSKDSKQSKSSQTSFAKGGNKSSGTKVSKNSNLRK